MSENAHNIDQPFQASMSVKTNQDIAVIQEALSRLHSGCQQHSEALIEARNSSARFKDECAELKLELNASMQIQSSLKAKQLELEKKLHEKDNGHHQLLSDLKNQLTTAEEKIRSLEENLEEQGRELGRQAKGSHDLNLLLMEKNNEYATFKKQAERKIAELSEASKTIEQMRKMLGGTQSSPEPTQVKEEKRLPPTDYSLTPPSPESMADSFEQWLKPAAGKTFHLLDDPDPLIRDNDK